MKTLLELIIFLAIWLLTALITRAVLKLFGIDPDEHKWANYLTIAIAAFTAGALSTWVQEQITKLF